MILLLLALASSPARVLVLDDTHQIERADWNYVEVPVVRVPSIVHCEYRVEGGRSTVRLALFDRADLEHFRANRAHPARAATSFSSSGRLHHAAKAVGAYAVVVESHETSRGPVRVRLRIEVESERIPSELSPARRALVIGIGVAVFFAAVVYAWRKLTPHLRAPLG